MKVISRTAVGFLSILFFIHTVSSRSSSTFGDIVVTTENGTFHCDSMICPPTAVSCHVTKRNDPNDFTKIVRVRKCIGSNQEVVTEETVFERNVYNRTVNVSVVSNKARELTPEERRELEESLRRIQKENQARLNETLRNAAKQRERILANIRNSRNKWY